MWRGDTVDDMEMEIDMETAMERMRDLQHMLHSREQSPAFTISGGPESRRDRHRQAAMRAIQERQGRSGAVDDSSRTRCVAALIAQASSEQPEEATRRERALRALADDAMQFDQHRNADHSTHDVADHYYSSAETMWSETKAVLVASSAEALPTHVRELALRAIGALVFHRPNSVAMWADAGVRDVLLTGAGLGQPEPVRFECHRTLSLLACEAANNLFTDPVTRAKVVEGAAPGVGSAEESAGASPRSPLPRQPRADRARRR